MIRSRKLKNGTTRIYDGNRIASQDVAKQFIKDKIKAGLTVKGLEPELARYQGRVKGGVNRVANSLADKGGHFLDAKKQKQAFKNMGIDIHKLMEAKKVKTIRQLFKKMPLVQKAFDKLLDTGIESWVNSHTAIDKIEDFTGDKIEINGKVVSKLEATKKVNDCLKGLKRKFGAVDASIKFRYYGLGKISMHIPTKGEIADMDEDSNIEDSEFSNDIQVYRSGKKK